MLLSLSLVGIVSQRLISTADGKSRLPAIEVLLPTPRVKDLIKQGDLGGIKGALAQGGDGMQSFDESLYRMVRAGRLSRDAALAYSDSPNDFRLRFLLEDKAGPGQEAPLRMGLR
jgi:twitching motility protein PilU